MSIDNQLRKFVIIAGVSRPKKIRNDDIIQSLDIQTILLDTVVQSWAEIVSEGEKYFMG